MTKDRDFKRLVRERMARTGESYAAARAQLDDRSAHDGGERFEIIQTRLYAALMRRLGQSGGPRHVDVTPDRLQVRMGSAFTLDAPRGAVAEASRWAGRVMSRGVHGGDGVWLVNGSGRNLVSIRFQPAVEGTLQSGALSGTVPVKEVRVSVDRPDDLIARLASGTSP